MSRKNKIEKRKLSPDAKYNSVLVTELINKVMMKGKKSVAERLVYDSLDVASKQISETALTILQTAIKNVAPKMEVKSKRVGGATYQVPVEVSDVRATSLAIKWIITFSRKRSGKSFVDFLSSEIVDAYNKTGSAMKKKDETHKMAESNRAFSHFR